MYNRKIKEMPNSLISNGKATFGTFMGHPKKLDIKDILFPFGVLPLPRFITNLRIRSSIFFDFSTDAFIGKIELFDTKIIGYYKLIVWEKITHKKYSYHHLMFLNRRLIPTNLEKASCTVFSKKRYARFTWDRTKDIFSLVFKCKGDSHRPSISASLQASFSNPQFLETTNVSPAPTTRRCSALYQMTNAFNATFSIRQKEYHEHIITQNGFFSFGLKRAYYNVRYYEENISFQLQNEDGAVFLNLFSSSIDSHNDELHNNNILIENADLSLLPPVKITRPQGFFNEWIIQDTESMVDLSFKPIVNDLRRLSIFLLHARFHTLLGTLSGSVRTKDNKEIQLKNIYAIASKQRLRL